jgi:hypothetical protein
MSEIKYPKKIKTPDGEVTTYTDSMHYTVYNPKTGQTTSHTRRFPLKGGKLSKKATQEEFDQPDSSIVLKAAGAIAGGIMGSAGGIQGIIEGAKGGYNQVSDIENKAIGAISNAVSRFK